MLKTNERLVNISNEGKNYYIYFTSELQYDENIFGKPIQSEVFYYLDENFNKFILNVSKEDAKQYSEIMKKNAEQYGRQVFVGSHSPEIEDIHGDYVPHTNPNVVGIWEKANKEEIEKYQKILAKQNSEKLEVKLA